MKIFTAKPKVMAFQGKEPVWINMIINYDTVNQVSLFNYLGNELAMISQDTMEQLIIFLENKIHKEMKLKF